MPSEPEAASAQVMTGDLLLSMLTTATTWLERNAASIDAINVFPVPDGDTGSNMLRTMQSAVEACEAGSRDGSVGAVSAAASHGALLGARGNSGVILSQWLRGVAEALKGAEQADGTLLGRALEGAAASAYASMSEPREGTMLSVAKAAGEAGGGVDGQSGVGNVAAVLARAQAAADAAVAKTPEQMPLLEEAGVVDAGGRGLAVLLEGFAFALRGEPLPQAAGESGAIDAAWLAGRSATPNFGYCTEFVVEGERIDVAGARAAFEGMGESVMAVGDASALHVHLHTMEPEAAFAYGETLGRVERRKAEDMSKQATELANRYGGSEEFAVVAVAAGEGFERLFKDFGVAAVVAGGATQNPSAAEILEAARSTHAADVLVLPNDRNIWAAAEQASKLSDGVRIRVVPTASMPEAVAALGALRRDAGVEEACAEMERAAAEVASGAVAVAARAVEAPVALRKGQPFAMVDGTIVAGAASVEEALVVLAETMLATRPGAELLTVYRGCDVAAEEAERAVERLGVSLDGTVEVELVIGEQPHYPFLVSLE